MVLQRCLAILGLAIILAISFSEHGWTQDAEYVDQGAQALWKSSGRDLDELFFGFLLSTAIAGILSGLASGVVLNFLRHRRGVHFPSRVRRFALSMGLILTMVFGGIYVGAGVWRQIHPVSVLTEGKSVLIPVLFATLWYLAAYVAIRFPRWSGRYALLPRLKGGWS
jgi:hypothetical protein